MKRVKVTKVLQHRLVFPENIESAIGKIGLDNQTANIFYIQSSTDKIYPSFVFCLPEDGHKIGRNV